jgi:two-component system chemotaxis response regulator CheY
MEVAKVLNVLVVDDSPFMARAMKGVLESMEFNVVSLAHDGFEGFEKFEVLRPDVVVLDITMPNMDGLECLVKIRQLDGDARIVMLSAVRDEETVAKCLASGAAAFLQKPICKTNPDDLALLKSTIETAAHTKCPTKC